MADLGVTRLQSGPGADVEIVFYDRENHDAWIQSTAFVVFPDDTYGPHLPEDHR